MWAEEPPRSRPDLLAGSWGFWFQAPFSRRLLSHLFVAFLRLSLLGKSRAASCPQGLHCGSRKPVPLNRPALAFMSLMESWISSHPQILLKGVWVSLSLSTHSFLYLGFLHIFFFTFSFWDILKKKKLSPITSPQLTQTFPFPEQLSHVGKQSAQ